MASRKKGMEIKYPQMLVGASTIGLVAAFWQATERIFMLKNPEAPLSCNLSPVVDCSGVLNDKLAAVFGPPNAFIGMVAFSLLLAFGLQRLTGGSWTKKVAKVVFGLSIIMMLFSLWFFWVSLYVIGKLCIFCIFIWVASMPIGIYGALDYLEGLKNPQGIMKWKRDFLAKYHYSVLIAVYALMIVLFLLKFQDYYFG